MLNIGYKCKHYTRIVIVKHNTYIMFFERMFTFRLLVSVDTILPEELKSFFEGQLVAQIDSNFGNQC